MTNTNQQIGVITHYPYRMSRPNNVLMQIHRDDCKNIETVLNHEIEKNTDNHTGYIIETYDEDSAIPHHNRICFFFSDSQAYLCSNLKTTDNLLNEYVIRKPIYQRMHADDLDPLRAIDCFLNLT